MAQDTNDGVREAPEGTENPPAAPSQPADPKPPVAPAPESPPDTTDWKAEAEKWKNTASNYKTSAERYWEIKKSGRLDELQPPAATPQSDVSSEPVVDETVVVPIRNDYLSKRSDVVDEFRGDVLNLTDDQFQRFKPLYRAVDELYDRAAKEQRFVARGEIRRRFKEMLDFAKGEPAAATKKAADVARREGQIEMLKAEQADLSVTSTVTPAKNTAGITDEDKEKSAESGGLISPERAAEIRRNKEKRALEYAP